MFNFLNCSNPTEPRRKTITIKAINDVPLRVSIHDESDTTPIDFEVNSGEVVSFTVNDTTFFNKSPLIKGDDTRYRFTNWMDGVSNLVRTVHISDDTTFTARVSTEYKVETSNDIPKYTSTNPKIDWYSSGDTLVLKTDSIIQNHVFENWIVNNTYHGYHNPLILFISEPIKVMAHYLQLFKVSITIPNHISGIPITIGSIQKTDSISIFLKTGEKTTTQVENIFYKSSFIDSKDSITRYQFVRWSDSSTDNPRTITVTTDISLTPHFTTEYKVCAASSPLNIASFPSLNGWFNLGDTLHTTAPRIANYTFSRWVINDSTTRADSTLSLTINEPKKILALYSPDFPDSLSSPDSLVVSADDRLLMLTWKPVNGATSYDLFVNQGSDLDTTVIKNITALQCSIPVVANGTLYSIRIRAVNPFCKSTICNPVLAIPLAAPEIVSGTINNLRIHLTWNSLPNAQQYILYRKNLLLNQIVPFDTLTDTVAHVQIETYNETQTFYITAKSIYTESAFGDSINITPLQPVIIDTAYCINDTARFKWHKQNPADSFIVFINNITSNSIITDTVSDTAWAINGLNCHNVYEFYLIAFNQTATSGCSDTLQFSPYSFASDITISSTPTTATLVWNTIDSINKYKITYYELNDSITAPKSVECISSPLIINNLVPGQLYTFSISAFHGIAESNKVSVIFPTQLASPLLTEISNSNDSVTLKWSTQQGSSYYKIYYTRYSSTADSISTDSTDAIATCDTTLKLSPGFIYGFTIKAFSNATHSSPGNEIQTGILMVPQNVNLILNNNNAFLQWNSVYGADGYDIYSVNGDNLGGSPVIQHTIDTMHVFSDVDKSLNQTYWVVAHISNYFSKQSKKVSLNFSPDSISCTPLGSYLTSNWNGYSHSYGRLQITWKRVPNATGYNVYYLKGESFDSNYATMQSVTDTTISLTNLTLGNYYAIAIKTIFPSCESQFSQPIVTRALLPKETINLPTTQEIEQKRLQLINYIWGTTTLPTNYSLLSIDSNIVDSYYLQLYTQQGNLLRIDRYTVSMPNGMKSVIYHFIPQVCNQKLIIYHAGHTYDGFRKEVGGGQYVIPELLKAGYAVLGFSMPLYCNPFADQTLYYHNDLYRYSHPLQYFFTPICQALNYIQEHFTYNSTSMIGLSGGGWTTTIYSAVDRRIKNSFPIAGSVPNYLRVENEGLGDAEQEDPVLYTIANYPELYTLGAYGPNRYQLQILNEFDACCFYGTRHNEWVPDVKNTTTNLGSGAYDFYLDSSHREHKISSNALSLVLDICNR